MAYKYGQRVRRARGNVKRYIIGATATLLMAGGMAFPALAAGSAPGYYNNPGRQQATEVGAQCDSGAGSGAFGAFGPGVNFAGGADGQATGMNNSALCGNRQGNL